MTLKACLDNWQHCSHTSDNSRDIHSYLISASFKTSDLTARCVSVCSSDALRKWRKEISSSVARSHFCVKLKENATETYEILKMA